MSKTSSHATDLEILNERGLHARAAAKFVKLTETFDAEVEVTRAGSTVSGRSIMGLLMLAASQGTEIHVEASGKQAEQALAAIAALVNDKFGEEA